jgi:hypothetical protein
MEDKKENTPQNESTPVSFEQSLNNFKKDAERHIKKSLETSDKNIPNAPGAVENAASELFASVKVDFKKVVSENI